MPLIHYLAPVQFDFGAVRMLGSELGRLGIRRPLFVTDRGIVESGVFECATSHLAGVARECVFDSTPENPNEAAVAKAAVHYKEQGCDGIVAIGGGSPIDLAKGAALAATHGGPLEQFAAIAGGMERITAAVAPVIAIPTTAGPGTEVGRATVIVLQSGKKLAIISPHLIPKSAICDPELTLTLPPRLTAGTGMDAIAHCIETFLSSTINPPADAIALDGLARGVAHIKRACDAGDDRAARWEMMMASLQGGLAFQKGLGAVHAMSHPLGALREVTVHHGTANAILLPAVLRFNAASAASKYDRIRSALGLSPEADLAVFFRDLARQLGLPPNLKAIGVPREKIPALAEEAVIDFSARTNCRSAGAVDYRRLYEESHG